MADSTETLFEGPKVEIRLRVAWCKLCFICTSFCPSKSLRQEGDRLVVDASNCNGCGMCEMRCPDFAIMVEKHEAAKSTKAGGGSEAETR